MSRNNLEFEEDIKKIVKLSMTASTLSNIGRMLNLSPPLVHATLKKHPLLMSLVKEQVKLNRDIPVLNPRLHSRPPYIEITNTMQKFEPANSTNALVDGVIIDSTVCFLKNLPELLTQIMQKTKIILTSSTIRTLDMYLRYEFLDNSNTEMLLNLATSHPEHFIFVLVDETYKNQEECILHYTLSTPKNVILLTACRDMAYLGLSNNVKTYYIPI